MSGHSKWSTIKRAKSVKDAARGAVFTKIGNQIAIAARGGVDPAMNPILAMVIEKAKQANMPNANIQRAIDRVADKSAAALDEVMYEGYGPGGTAVIVEAATDNKNRTYPEVRHAFTKNGGNIAEPGSVAFQFDRKGIIRINFSGDPDDALLQVLDAGAEDAVQEDDQIVIYTEPKALHAVRKNLVDASFTITDAELGFIAKN
ncbi:MAG TPA: YebC/PmpR family DNA-binding transcriptional regulator, partial [Candidatus Saccharimonadales bacterium]|nr:YebC/PmpR family DNA-binding transcriptional regulator [Candidatus Saccharimonadales bacterium]